MRTKTRARYLSARRQVIIHISWTAHFAGNGFPLNLFLRVAYPWQRQECSAIGASRRLADRAQHDIRMQFCWVRNLNPTFQALRKCLPVRPL